MSGTTVRFAAEFDDTELVRGLNEAKSSITSLTTNIEPISLFGPEVLQDLDKLEQSTNSLEQSFTGLDSASTGIGGTFQEIGDAANQAGDNFNTLGTAGATVEQQLAEIGTTSSTAGQSMSALGGSADTTATSMGALQSNFEGVSGGLTDTNTLFGETTGAMADVSDQAESTGSTLKEQFAKGSAIAVGISATISGIANLVRGFRDYGDAQLKVQKTTRTLGVQQLAAKGLQEKYNQAVAEYGANSAEAIDAGTKYQLKLDQIRNTQEQLAIQIKRVGDSQQDVWLGLAGTITGISGSIIQSLDAIGGAKGIGGLVSKFGAAQLAVGGFSASIAGLISAFTIVGGGIALAIHLLEQDTKTMNAFADAGIKLTTVQQDSNRAFAEMEAIMRVTHMSMLQVIEDPAAAAAKYKELGGQVDATGKIVADSVDQWDSAHSGIQILFDTISKGVATMLNLDKQTKAVEATTNSYTPTVINLAESYKSVWKEGAMVTESYTRGAKALNMYGVEQQTTAETTKLISEGFANLPGAVDKGTKSITSQGTATTALVAKFGPLEIALPDLEADTIALAEAMGKGAQADIDRKNTLAGVTNAAKLAATQFTEFTDNSKLAGEVNAELRKKLEAYVTTELHVQNAQSLTIQQMKDLIDAHFDTEKATEMATKAAEDNKKAQEDAAKEAEKLAKAQRDVRDAMAESVSAFSDITGALTKEDFSKAFKEFKETMKDLIPKETMNNVKTFFQDLQTNSQGLGKVSKAIDVLFAAITTGTDKLSSTDLKGIIGGMSNELERMAAINPRAAAVNKLLFEPLQKLDGSALTSKIAQIGDAINIAKTAMDKGWITADAYNDIVAALAKSSGNVATPLGAIGTATDKATTGLDKTGTAGATAAPKLDAVAEALNSVILAGEDVGKRIAAIKFNFPAPNLSQYAQAINDAFKAAQQTATKITALKPVLKITGDNKQALTAINQVVNAQGKIKNIVQVIKGNNSDALSKINQVVNAQGKIKNITQTITTVYKTVGSPVRSAHNITGVRAHNITTTEAGAGAISVAPLIGGGNTNMSNFNGGGGMGGTGDVNVTIINRDEFGTEKIRKYKAVLGKDRYIFGAVGSGG